MPQLTSSVLFVAKTHVCIFKETLLRRTIYLLQACQLNAKLDYKSLLPNAKYPSTWLKGDI